MIHRYNLVCYQLRSNHIPGTRLLPAPLDAGDAGGAFQPTIALDQAGFTKNRTRFYPSGPTNEATEPRCALTFPSSHVWESCHRPKINALELRGSLVTPWIPYTRLENDSQYNNCCVYYKSGLVLYPVRYNFYQPLSSKSQSSARPLSNTGAGNSRSEIFETRPIPKLSMISSSKSLSSVSIAS